MKARLAKLIDSFDKIISNNYLRFFKERNSLMVYLFHGLFKDENEIAMNHVHPQQKITIKLFREFIEYHLNNGFVFISPGELLEGLNEDKKYLLLTFDDGYYNNIHSLDILNEYDIPAIFFISSNNIEQNQCFWWDIVYRERIKRNIPLSEISKEISDLKKKKARYIQEYIIREFGNEAFSPISNIDRPFTRNELVDFSNNRSVYLGNHTVNHAILTNYNSVEIATEIEQSQIFLKDVMGSAPDVISYPNGNFSNEVLNISKKLGLKLGITTKHRKNYLPIDFNGLEPYLINRFTLWGSKDLAKQCDSNRSDFYLKDKLSSIFKFGNSDSIYSY